MNDWLITAEAHIINVPVSDWQHVPPKKVRVNEHLLACKGVSFEALVRKLKNMAAEEEARPTIETMRALIPAASVAGPAFHVG